MNLFNSHDADGLIDKAKLDLLVSKADEARVRFFKCLAPFAVLFVLGLCYPQKLMNFLARPLVAALPKGAQALHFTNPLDVVFVYIQVAFLAAFLATTPIWVYQAWRFLEHILGEREKRYVMPFIVSSTVLFLSGAAFCYYFMLPTTLDFLIGFGMEVATPLITMGDYMTLVAIFELSFGLVFELPVIMVVLSLFGLVNSGMLKKYRSFVVVGILVVAAVLTPSPDPASQLLMAIPMYVLYEAGIVIVKWMEKKESVA